MGIQIVGPPRRSDVMLGRLLFRPAEAGADVSIGIQPWAGGRELVLGAWDKLVQRRAQEICPKKFGD